VYKILGKNIKPVFEKKELVMSSILWLGLRRHILHPITILFRGLNEKGYKAVY